MSTAGTIPSLGGGAAAPDPDRVAAIRAGMSENAEAAAAFGEGPAATLAALLDRARAVTDAAPHAEAAALLAHARDRVAGLDPARLEPRDGLAGLFDSRGKRLKAFRAAFVAARDAVGAASADLMERAGVVGRRQADLDGLWTEIRDAVADLDAHIAAGRAWLADRLSEPEPSVPPEAAAAFEDSPDADGDPPVEAQADAEASLASISKDPAVPTVEGATLEATATPSPDTPEPMASISTLPHPLETRLANLKALRTAGVAQLPLIRATQNADHAVPATLQSARDQIEAWTADWREALGLNGKRPRKVRPDRVALLESRDALTDRLSAAERAAAAAQGRLAELRPRTIVTAAEDRAAA